MFVAEKQLKSGSTLYRSRVGFEGMEVDYGMGFESENHYIPFSGSKISAPIPCIVGSGRVNRAGVSFLYCATDKHTSIAEVRPHPGDHVSIGKFILNKDVQVYDFSENQLINFSSSDRELDSYKAFNTLGVLIHKTVPPSDKQFYSITQLIADCIRQIGFDGISFSSSVGRGINYVFFNPNLATYSNEESEVVEIKKVSYEYESAPLVQENGIYK